MTFSIRSEHHGGGVMETVDIQFGVLGSLQVRLGDAHLVVPGRRPSIVLASLAMSAGRMVTLETLADHVWADQLPLSATDSLRSLVSRLRSVVGPATIQTMAAGYLLDVDPDQVDLLRFRRLLDEAGVADDPGKARDLLGAALSLWRGDPLAGLNSERLQRDVVPGLVEEHLAALERRIRLDLAAGLQCALVAELRELVSRHPLRESLWRLLITAQDEAGRRADALETYHRLRIELRERLGVEPAGDLQALYHRLLVDPTVAPAATSVTHDEAQAPRAEAQISSNELPGDISDFTGRDRELNQLLAAALPGDGNPQTVTISAINGMAGVGKTTLAVHLAHRLADRFPDGQLFVDLHGHTPGNVAMEPAAALDYLLRALGLPSGRIPDSLAQRSGLWRSELSRRRVLVLLDNAATAAQVRPLIPGAAGCLAIVTSRQHIADLDGAHTVSLDVLPEPYALALFTAIVGADRSAAEPAAVAEVLRQCGYLPLAIRIAGARLNARPAWSVAYLAARLADEQHRLAELTAGERSVASTFTLSYRHLPAAHQRMFRLLGLHPGTSIDAYLAAALAGIDLREAESLLEDLLDAHLLHQSAPDRYRFHDLLRQYAHDAAIRDEGSEDRDQAVQRMLDYYVCVTDRVRSHLVMTGGPTLIEPTYPPAHLPSLDDRSSALAWSELERTNLTAIISYAADHGWDKHVCQLSNAVWWFFRIRGYLHDWMDAQHRAVDAAQRLGDAHDVADMERILGVVYWESGQYSAAIDHYQKALVLYRETGDSRAQAITLSNLGLSYWRNGQYERAHEHHQDALICCRDAGGTPHEEAAILVNLALVCWRGLARYDAAIEHADGALNLYRQINDQRGQGGAMSNLGLAHGSLGNSDKALDYHRRAIELVRASGDRVGESDVLNDYAETLRTLGFPDQARDYYRRALEIALKLNSRVQQARAHNGIAFTLRDTDAAQQHWQQALDIFTDLGLPDADDVRLTLSTRRLHCGQAACRT
ncbi:DNA-binding SARP family transcriptional activator/Tfp pilus assembly protein PilF [Catenulispora sp. GAS73]|uniref:AfsR/SARP family transcriptional regulator n=1 Tax=Catenulispora sp. GAS73 TaxID=3156269 RepID=UPI0035137607